MHQAAEKARRELWWLAEGRAAQRFAMHAPPICEPAVCLTAFLAALWPHYMAERFKRRMLNLLELAITEKVPQK